MKTLKAEVVVSGIVNREMVTEFQNWAAPLDDLADIDWDNVPKTAEAVVARIREALESSEQVEIRSTDLNIMRRYLTHQQEGKLHLEDPVTEQKSNIKITFAFTEMGDVVIPWRNETISDMLLNVKSYLRIGDKKYYFVDVEELYFGKTKTFMLCKVEPLEGKDE